MENITSREQYLAAGYVVLGDVSENETYLVCPATQELVYELQKDGRFQWWPHYGPSHVKTIFALLQTCVRYELFPAVPREQPLTAADTQTVWQTALVRMLGLFPAFVPNEKG